MVTIMGQGKRRRRIGWEGWLVSHCVSWRRVDLCVTEHDLTRCRILIMSINNIPVEK